MKKEAFTLKEKNNTGEYHIFRGVMTEDGCTSSSLSICEKMKKTESTGNKFTCKNENEARKRAAEIGRAVCGICVSHLYTTY